MIETKAQLEAAGFRETSVQELLELTHEEMEMIETRLALGASRTEVARAISGEVLNKANCR